ncbi:MAG: hypothetical protein HYZ50_18470 [Deltaproteobacteria bacterium]|nr:hypothetical protein [Deltaproteobacteria bacterium]
MPERFTQIPSGTPNGQPIITGHEKIAPGHWLGRLTCLLAAKTAVSIFRGRKSGGLPQKSGQPFLPGSSIKGVVRSFAEALTHSCSPLPNQAMHCQSRTTVCPACRLFGAQFGRQEQQGEGAYQSKVLFSDAEAVGRIQSSLGEIMIHTHSRHPSPKGGRIFYQHFSPTIEPFGGQPGGKGRDNDHAAIEYVLPQSQFTFIVDFSNLAGDELSLLLYSLVLEEGMAHKLGFGKAKGLGSIQIQITHLQASNQPQEVYLSLTTPHFTHDLTSPEEISQFVQARREPFLSRLDHNQVQQLRATLALPPELRDPSS